MKIKNSNNLIDQSIFAILNLTEAENIRNMNSKLRNNMRTIHRYLGFFLAGIMAVYAISGTVLVFRNTDFLKKEIKYDKTVDANIPATELSSVLKVKGLKVTKTEGDVLYFKQGNYNQKTGNAVYTVKKLPFVLDKMTKLHKATTNDPLYYLNLFFGASLLFFVISSFWMFMPSSNVFKKGLYFTIAGIVLTMVMLFI